MFIIGIAGKAGAGKSTLAKFIRTQIDVDCEITPFAKPLKDFAFDLGWNGKKDEKGRKLLQLLGTDVGRNCIHRNIWVNKWTDAIRISRATVIIADDIRFPNEINYVNGHKGNLSIKIKGREYKDIDDTHESEQELSDKKFKVIINNDKDLVHLQETAEELVEYIGDSIYDKD